MPAPLLATKLYVPSPRTNLVARPTLVRRLDEGLQLGRRLTLISAPAGAGKTTLLSAWLHHRGKMATAVAWLSLEEADNDPVRFWMYAVAAFQTVHPDLGRSALQILESPQLSAAASASILTPLLNEMTSLAGPLVLVLDDYHVISSQAIHDGIAFVLDHQPQQLHLVIATRADPSLPVARLRARGQLTELRADDLRFTVDEAAAFLNEVMGLDLTPGQVQALEARTEGWVVGLQLAALSMQGRADKQAFISGFTGSHHYVLEYLAEEVLRRQPRPLRQFLLETSTLDRLCGPLCDAVTGGSGSETTLADLRRDNLFIVPLDDEHYWYRYHHLFADLLGARLRQLMSPEDVAALHLRASAWYESHEVIAEAVKYALMAKDFKRAVALIEANVATMTSSGELTTLLTWIGVLPTDLVQSRPMLCILQALALIFSGHFDDVEPLLQAAEQQASRDASAPTAEFVLGNVATARAFIADRTGDVPRAIEFARMADEFLPKDDLMGRSLIPYILGRAHRAAGDLTAARQAAVEMVRIGRSAGNDMTAVMGLCELATLYKLQGKLREAAGRYHEAQQQRIERGELQFVTEALVDVGLAELELERNDLEAAREHAGRVVEILEQMPWGGAPTDLVWAYTALARVQIANGDFEGASDALYKAAHARRRFNDFPGFGSEINACQVRLWLAKGDLDRAVRWIQEHPVDESAPLLSREREQITRARVLIAQGRGGATGRFDAAADIGRDVPPGQFHMVERATQLLAQLARDAEIGGRLGRLIEIQALLALGWYTQSEIGQAIVMVEQALSLAEPEGYVRVFVGEGAPMAELLAQVTGPLRAYAQRLLAHFPVDYRPALVVVEGPSVDTLGGVVEPLTARELEILGLISTGHSNQEIAERLVVTLNTVKKHASNIYSKLGVNSRTQAVARARELGLID